MAYSEAELIEAFESRLEDVQRKERLWTGGKAPQDGVQGFLRNTAKSFQRLASCAVLLGATRQSRVWFGQAARYYLESIDAARVRRDICARGVWESEPRRATQALTCALVSHDEDRLTDAAAVALEMDECYLDVFAEDYTDFPALYDNAMAIAAVAVDDPRAPEIIDELRGGVDQLTEPSEYWTAIPEFYQAIIDGEERTATERLDELFEYYDDESTDTAGYVLHQICAFVRLARRHGLDLTVASPRVPDALVRESVQDDTELDVGSNLTDLTVASCVGRFELDRDDEGTPVIAGYMYHVGDVEVHASDVPEREAGQLLSEGWVEAALEEAQWREHYDDDLVADATEAFADGTLRRKLVVLQDRVDGPTFDASLAELPIDKIDLRKGAGRRS